MKLKRWASIGLVLILCVAIFAACAKKPGKDPTNDTENITNEAETDETETPDFDAQTTDKDAEVQKTAADFAGTYGSGRCTIIADADADGKMTFSVSWGASAFETVAWTMSGAFDPDTQTVSYSDCVKTDVEFADGGSKTETVVYENGMGQIKFGDGNLTWEDENEQIADDMVFVRSSAE